MIFEYQNPILVARGSSREPDFVVIENTGAAGTPDIVISDTVSAALVGDGIHIPAGNVSSVLTVTREKWATSASGTQSGVVLR